MSTEAKQTWSPRALGVAWALFGTLWLCLHAPLLEFSFVNWDDDRFVLGVESIRNPAAASWRSLLLTPELGYPIPLTRAVFAAEWAWFAGDPRGWHALSVVLHAAGVGLFAVLAWRTLRSGAGALLAAMLLLHPVGAEPVSWVAAQKDLLATMFATAGVLHAAGAQTAEGARGGAMYRAARVVLLLLLALASKPSVALFGLVAAVAWGPARDRVARAARLGVALIPTAAAVVSAVLTTTMQRELGALRESAGVAERLAAVVALGASALRRLLWPVGLSPTYDVDAIAVGSAGFALGAALLLLMVAALLWAAATAKDAATRVGAAWLLASWLPVSGLAGTLARGTSDSYLALWLPGLALLVAAGVLRGTERAPAKPAVAAALIVCVLAPLRWAAHQPWRNSVTLWEHAWVQVGPLPWVCRNLGYAHVFAVDGDLPDTPEPYLRAHAVWSQCPERNERNLRRAEEVLLERWGIRPSRSQAPVGAPAP